MALGDLLPWASTSLLSAQRAAPGGATYGGFLYILGGSSSTSEVRFAEIQNDGTIDAWTLTTPLPGARAGCTAFANNGFLYCVGGEDGGGAVVDTVFVAPINLDGTIGAWVSTTVLPAVRSRHVGYVNNSFAYVTGGVDALGDQQSTVYVAPINLDGTLGAWVSTTALPTPLYQHSGIIANGFIYVLGGITPGFVTVADVLVAPVHLDGTIGAWASTTALPGARWGHSSIVHSGFVYVVVGGAGESSVLHAPINLDGTLGAWAATTDFAHSRANAVSVWAPTPAGALPVVDAVFVFGGADESPTASRPTWSAAFDATPAPAFEVEIPAAYFDNLTTDADEDLDVTNRAPEPGETGASIATLIELDLVDTKPTGAPSTAGTRVYVGGVLAFDGGVFQAGWDGPGSAFSNPQPDTLRIAIDPTVDFASLQVVSVRVVSITDDAAATVDETYSFTCEDLTPPRVLAAQARDFQRIRITFDEAVVQDGASLPNDALNPANYSFTRRMLDPTEAAVNVVPVSVEHVDGHTVDVLTDIELSQIQPYLVVVARVRDIFGNVVAYPYDRANFEAFRNPAPAGRVFNLYRKLPRINRDQDVTRDMKKFLSVNEDMFGLLLSYIDRYPDQYDPDIAAEKYVNAMLDDLGYPFDFELDLADKRRLIKVLAQMYRQKGTAPGIVNVIRFFMGVEVTVAALLAEGMTLGVSLLGVDWILGPGTSWGRYAFEVISPRVLTADERERMTKIINYMKVAEEHLAAIVEPVTPVVFDHWVLGESILGGNTDLH